MTVSSNNTAELSIDQIIRQALVAVGMMPAEAPMDGPQWLSRAAVGREHLQLLLGQLQSKNYLLRALEDYTVDVESGDGSEDEPIELPGDTIDVVGDAMWAPSSSTKESPVKQIGMADWHTYSDKATESPTPWAFAVQKHGTVSLRLLQPASAAGTLRLRRQKLLANFVNAQGRTADVERSWVPYFMWSLAAYFAGGTLPIQAANARAQARQAFQDAVPAAGPRLPRRFVFGRWGG